MNSKKLLEAFNYVDEAYLEQAEARPRRKGTLKKRVFMLIAAILCISILSVTAIAELPSVFQYLKQMDPEDAPLYEAAEAANRDTVPEPVELPQLKEASLIVNEKYYNGQTVLLGLDVKAVEGDPAIGFVPDADLMKQIRAFGHVDTAFIWEEPAAAVPYSHYAGALAASLQHELTPDQYKKLEQCMEAYGYCCVVMRDAFVGDHIHVNGTDMMATYDMDVNAYAGITEGNTPAGEVIRLDPLPENAQDQEEVTVALNIKSGLIYYYLDTQGHGFTYYAVPDSVTAEITIQNSEQP